MARSSAKRTLEEIANKSDSDDDDYSDHPIRKSRHSTSKSRSKTLKRAKKRRRHGSDDDDLGSDDESLSDVDEISFAESEEQDDGEVERNARGIALRKAARNRPVYRESDSEDEVDENEDDVADEVKDEHEKGYTDVPPRTRKSTLVKLKISSAVKALSNAASSTARRTTRHNRDPSEDIYALTNSGRHVETVERGTRTPEPQPQRRRLRHGSRESNPAVDTIEEESETGPKVNNKNEEGTAPLEILESDPQGDDEDDRDVGDLAEKMTEDINIGNGDVVPESEGELQDVKDDEDDENPSSGRRRRNRSDPHDLTTGEEEPVDEATLGTRRSSRKKPARSSQRKGEEEGSDFEPNEEESDDELSESGKSRGSPRKGVQDQDDDDESSNGRRSGLRKRKSQSRGRGDSETAVDIAEELAEELENLRGDRPRRRVLPEIIFENKPRRSRKDVDYRIIRPDLVLPTEEAENEPTESPSRRGRGGGGGGWQRTLFSTFGPFGGGGVPAVLGGSSGAPGATAGVESDSSDDENMQNPKGLGTAGLTSGLGGAAGLLPGLVHNTDATNQGLSGTPANFGRIKDKQALADADPLGVDPNVNFDSVGGLQGHIDQLKEMISLPLLYPEIFQRFHITPPRGVLFHGPPGTGKTLMARALASSVSSEGRKVTFYMRKGADALSKWVGEAERQLRLLFEEARRTQPSIIFFDEIDGLAPVRSSKQEQIHSSIVSTLLALMDGMDGRGQVIVIGATNRPDSIDPALRRPGRFDREFYFPLPNKEGRHAILDIHTRGWDPPLPDDIKDVLAELTKGYGGADLRALCTESALNAVQRRYPQIYKSKQKLLIDPKTINVTPKDFMMSLKKIVPSSERSTSSGATPLPKTVEPLLRERLLDIEKLLANILPQKKRLTALEEAQFEEPEGRGGFQREQMQQEFETHRVFRPRLLIRGMQGMGQQYLAGALLHHFEGLHVQSFDLPTLLGDSTHSPEATVIQLFTEAKRHKPSVIYIPNIQAWYTTVGPAVIATFLGLLRSIPPTDPVLLLGLLEEEDAEDLDQGLVKTMFGFSKENVYSLASPTYSNRHNFFANVIRYIKTPPSDFPDPENRKKRKLEVLEIAPPPPPKPATPLTKEQLKAQKKKDYQTLNLLKIRIQPIMDQIKKYKRFRTGVIDESQIRYLFDDDDPQVVTSDLPLEQRTSFRPFEKHHDKHGVPGLRETVSGKFYYNLEIVTIEKRLSNGYYKRPKDFLADIKRLAKDARRLGDQERLLRANELLSNVEVDIATIEQTDPALVTECENVYARELERETVAIEQAKTNRETEGIPAPSHHHNVPYGNTESSLSSGPVLLGEPFSNVSTQTGARPVTLSRPSNISFVTNGTHVTSHPSIGGEHGANGNEADISREQDGDTYMTNSDDVYTGGRNTANSSFGPSAQPKPPLSHTAPSQQIRRQSGLSSLSQRGTITPMAPGSQPGDYTNEASTTQTTSDKKTSENSSGPQMQTQSPGTVGGFRGEYPDLTMYPDRVSQEEHLPDTQQELALSQGSILNGSLSKSKGPSQGYHPPIPLFDNASKPYVPSRSNIQNLLNKQVPDPKMDIDNSYLEKLHEQLSQQTSGCSVEQLEQINTSLMDCVWQMRGEWDRTKVAFEVTEAFNKVLEDMQQIQRFGSISQNTRDQLTNAGVRF